MSHVFLVLVATCCMAFSAETNPIVPTRIIDANTLEVVADLAGQQIHVRVAIQYVLTPRENSKQVKAVLYKLLGTGTQNRGLVPVVLYTSDERFQQDENGRTMAIIKFPVNKKGEEGVAELSPISPLVPNLEFPYSPGESIQEYLVRNGLAVYVHKNGDAPEPLHSRLVAARIAAQQEGVGLWKTAGEAMLTLEAATVE